MGRPRIYSGNVIGVKLPATLEIKIRGEAAKSGKSISQIVRASLERTHGGENEATDAKN
ncbi:MAG: hypothetical protein KJ822_17565 [Proteobacteria bacterium]|nr:hypothetical protein [Pseudomonadota bacterium]